MSGDYEPDPHDDIGQVEYYNPLQTYYSLGYWPEELYRFGVVYIFMDDSLSPVYNLRGCKFSATRKVNFNYGSGDLYSTLKDSEGNINYLPKDPMLNSGYLDNTKGVFHMPNYKDARIYRQAGQRKSTH